jgi:hypothetical protein
MSLRAMAIVVFAVAAAIVVGLLVWDRGSEAAPRPPASSGAAQPDEAKPERNAPPSAPASRPRRPAIQARASDEGAEPVAEPLPVTGQLIVTVVGADGRPIANAGVAPTAADGDLFAGWTTIAVRTGADGTARVGIADATTHVVVTAPGWAPALARIENRERMRVVLGGEVTLRGKVLVDGSPPPGPLMFTALGYEDPTDAWPLHPRQVARREGFGEMRIPFETDARGDFAVRGPAHGSTATIQIPAGYRFADSPPDVVRHEISVVCNGEPVVLDLVALKAITGRVVAGPVGDARQLDKSRRVELRYVLTKRGSPPITGSAWTLFGEKFAIYFTGPALDEVDVQVWSSSGRRWAGRHVQEPIPGSKDLGDIEVSQPSDVRFRITDAAGAPIEGARVHADGFVSERTDSDGRARCLVPVGPRAVIAGAPRFKLASFPLPDKLSEVVELRLERSVTLVVRVKHKDPSVDVTGLRVALSFIVEDSVLGSTARPEFNDVRGDEPASGGGSGNHQTRVYHVAPDRGVIASGFTAGEAVDVRVEDQYRHVLLQESVFLAETDVHPIEMVVLSKAETIRGTILGADGKPLAGALVGMPGFWRSPWSPRTDETGKFDIPGSFNPTPSLEVSAPGHVGKTIRVEKPAEPVTIQLERARQLVVTLTGPGNDPFGGSVSFEAGEFEAYHAFPRGERLFWFETIPGRPGVVKVVAPGGQTASASIGGAETRISVAIPR